MTPGTPLAVDMPQLDKNNYQSLAASEHEKEPKGDRGKPAWHGTLFPASDADIWLAAAFAEYEKVVAAELAGKDEKEEGTSHSNQSSSEAALKSSKFLAKQLYPYRSDYLSAAAVDGQIPLTAIHPRNGDNRWYRIASGRGVLCLHALRETMDRENFVKAMDRFGTEHAGKEVTSEQFITHVEKESGKQLKEFFRYWLEDKGLPTLALTSDSESDGGRAKTGSGSTAHNGPAILGSSEPKVGSGIVTKFSVDVEIRKPDPYGSTLYGANPTASFGLQSDTQAPIAFRILSFSDKGLVGSRMVTLGEGEKTATPAGLGAGSSGLDPFHWIHVKQLLLDPQDAILCRNGGVFNTLSFMEELEKTLIVYGTKDEEAANKEAAEDLQDGLIRRHANLKLPIKSDKQVSDEDLRTHHLLLIGRPDSNAVVERCRAKLPVTFGARSIRVQDKTYAHPGSAALIAAENPLDPRYSIVVVAGLGADSTVHAAIKLANWTGKNQVVVLPHLSSAQAVVIMPPEFQKVLDAPAKTNGATAGAGK